MGVPTCALARPRGRASWSRVHGTLSLAAVAVLPWRLLVTSVLDPFAPLRLTDAVIPFTGRYRPVWVGLGAVAFDLLVVVVVTSLLRRRIGARAWRGVHWAAYACWPPALAHTLGTGSDVRRGWMLALSLACAGVVVTAVGTRLATASGRHANAARAGALAVMATGAVALALWLPSGPLGRDWARRAGTPAELLKAPAAEARTTTPAAPRLRLPFSARARGTLRSGVGTTGPRWWTSWLRTRGAPAAVLDVRLSGRPVAGGGVTVSRSQVTLGPPGDPARYIGDVATLDGSVLEARLRPVRGRALRAHIVLDLSGGTGGGPVTATISARREAPG